MIAQKYLELLACPVCRGALSEKPEKLVCLGCGRTYPVTEGIPRLFPEEDLKGHFAESLQRWNDEWARQGLPDPDVEADPAYATSLDHIRAHAPAGAWGPFLEAGCGNGRVSLVMAREKRGLILGVDACWEACKLARDLLAREGHEGLFVAGDLRRLPFRDNAIGYIYAGGSMEHFKETQAAFSDAQRVLRPGGKLTATVPVISIATLTYSQTWGNIPDLPLVRPLAEWFHQKLLGGRHMRYGYEKSFTPGKVRRFFRRAGFREIQTGRFEVFMDIRLAPWPWLKALARRLARSRWFWPMIYADGVK